MELLKQIFQNTFDTTPPVELKYTLLLTIISGIFVTGAIALRIYIKKNKEDKAFKKVFRDFPGKMMTVGVILGGYIFFRINAVAFFSMRVIMYLTLLAAAWLVYRLVTSYLQKYPLEKKHREEQMHKNEALHKYRHKKR